jgi:hypothetical protein
MAKKIKTLVVEKFIPVTRKIHIVDQLEDTRHGALDKFAL